ncbi:MAG: histidine phosphatase family protein [Bdellovibrionales bacterium]|nr:histidine phosphatase family protein [Bdellovibrionales bacterium]
MGKFLFGVRHGVAEDKVEFALRESDDSLRPLTKDGIKKLHAGFEALARLESLETILFSPWTRALQTAEILAEYFPKAQRIETTRLTPNRDHDGLIEEINKYKSPSLAIVGHEPHLSEFTSYLLTGSTRPFLSYKKGGVAKLEFETHLKKQDVHLRWLAVPRWWSPKHK